MRVLLNKGLKLLFWTVICSAAGPMALSLIIAAWFAIDPASFSDAWLDAAAFVDRLV